MGRLFEGFHILCTDHDNILGKRGIVFKKGHYIKEDIIQGNSVLQSITNSIDNYYTNHENDRLAKLHTIISSH